MKILSTFIVGAVFLATGVLMPRSASAQQSATARSERQQSTEEASARRRAMARPPAGMDDSSQDEENGPSGGVNVQVTATADDRTNSVVVRGPAEVLDLIAEVLADLDDTTTKVAGIRVFQLKYADAMNTADMINELFSTERNSSQNNQRGFGPMMFRGPGGRGDNQNGQQDSNQAQVVAAADSQTNTVVVTGPDNILEIVAQVVERLDAQIPTLADVKVFHLEYADAQDTAELINEVFGESRTSSRSSSRNSQQNQRVQFGFGGRGGQQQATGGGSSSDVSTIAAADTQTNSVVVSGPAETLAAIENVVKELDKNPEQERQIFVYPLKNADAANLMEILNNLFEELQALNQGTGTTGQQFQGGQRGGQQGGAATAQSSSSNSGNDLDEETYFEADSDTNSLLILTSTKNYERLKPIIDKLDEPVAQVLIKVLFAELSHSHGVDFGTNFSMLNLRSDGGSTETSTEFGTPLQGLQVRTLTGDLDFTISALQEKAD